MRIEEKQQQFKQRKDELAAKFMAGHEKAQKRLAQLEQEIASPMEGGVTEKDRSRLDSFEAEIEKISHKQSDIRARIREQENENHKLQRKKVSLQSTLDEKSSELESLKHALDDDALNMKREELDRVKSNLKKCKEDIAGKNKQMKSLQSELEAKQKEVEAIQAQKASQQQAQDDETAVEDLLQQQEQMTAYRDDVDGKMRDLGALGDTISKFSTSSNSSLQSQLRQIKKQIKESATVNHKAVEEFGSFIEEEKRLLTRKQELVDAESSIHRLMATLDAQKDECLARTFKHVSDAFTRVFQDLVPGGHGELLMTKNSDHEYMGVKVRVQFGNHEPMSMRQLSGGQKTLVSLALIFAIQRTDPAPFYLLDEVDAALDPQYRKTVAEMLAKQATSIDTPQGIVTGSAQFIVTTFHPQILTVADKAYSVQHSHRISTIQECSLDAAMRFVSQDKSHERVAAGTSRIPSQQEERPSKSVRTSRLVPV